MNHTLRRQEVIHENFFTYLKASQTTMSAYALLHGLDRTLLSKWKSGASNMSPEQIHQASIYFKIAVNNLYYTNKELLRLQAEDTGFQPIIPQKIKVFRNYKPLLKKPVILLILLLLSFMLVAFISYIVLSQSIYYVLLNFVSIIFGIGVFTKYLRIKESYIINYTDDIYYQVKPVNKILVKPHIILRVIIFALSLIILVGVSVAMSELIEVSAYQLSFYVVILLFYMIIDIGAIMYLPYRHKEVRYDHQFEGYDLSVYLVIFGILQFVIAVLMFLLVDQVHIMLPALSFIMFGINIIDFILISKAYNQFEIVFDTYGGTPQKLYKD